MAHAVAPAGRQVDRRAARDDHLGRRRTLADELGDHAVEQGADHAREAEGAPGAHRVDGGLADRRPAEEIRGIQRRQQGRALMQVARHHAEPGRDDPAGVAFLRQDIHGGGGAHADDDGGSAGDQLGADAVGETVLADLARRRVIETQAADGVVAQVVEGQAGGEEHRLDRRGDRRDHAGQGEAGRRVGAEQGGERGGVEPRGRQLAVRADDAPVDDAPVRVRVADIETEQGHGSGGWTGGGGGQGRSPTVCAR